jgi:glycosyltransferase involved in cell wall biosynthesis
MPSNAAVVRPERTAIVHDWLTVIGGAEGVVKEMVATCPNSEIFTVFQKPNRDIADIVQGRPVHVSRLNRLPGVRSYYKHLLLLAARAVEAFDVSGFDVVVSSSAAVAKGVITSPGQPHISYIHSPARYAWDLTHEYMRLHGLERGMKGLLAREFMHRFRKWDARTIDGVDIVVANSQFIRERIWKVYRRNATIVYPPVDTARFDTDRTAGRHFVTTSRLVGHKRVDLMIDAFAARRDLQLKVVGEGPELAALKARATPNIEFLGALPDQDILAVYREARAFLHCAVEDFGIAPVEAQAAGLPVIALGMGGTAETVIDRDEGRTGVYFAEQTPASLLEAIARFETLEAAFDIAAIKANAARFSRDSFHRAFADLVARAPELARVPPQS